MAKTNLMAALRQATKVYLITEESLKQPYNEIKWTESNDLKSSNGLFFTFSHLSYEIVDGFPFSKIVFNVSFGWVELESFFVLAIVLTASLKQQTQ